MASLGECLVASPSQVRGYEGDSWLPDFAREPIPAYRAPHAAWTRPPPEEQDDEEAAAKSSRQGRGRMQRLLLDAP